MQLYIHEIVQEAEKKKSLEERKKYLSQFRERKPLRALLEISYNPDIEVLIPDTEPPYRKSELPEGMNYTRLDSEFRRFDIFLKNGRYPDMNQTKREGLFLNILESLHPGEADIFAKAFIKKFHIKGMRAEHINEVFGTHIPTPKAKKSSKSKKETQEASPVEG